MVVFCDGDFWHGRNWDRLSNSLKAGSNSGYWLKKIEGNIERDQRVRSELEALGWLVYRVWETDIHKDVEAVAQSVTDMLMERMSSKI